MTNNRFQHYKCWDDQRISKVINKEAVSIDPGEFLATHTPFDQIRYLRSPHQIKSGSENELLSELEHRSSENLHTLVVLQGIPGTGKSHLIRWLKERYRHSNDLVLLIERSNSTLKGTLRQIIGYEEIFKDDQMKDHLEKLQGAFDRLSEDTLADELIDKLRTGTKMFLPPPPQIGNRIYDVLMDINVRRWLKRSGGPIERIMRHLTKDDKKDGLKTDEHPGFVDGDFVIDDTTRSNLYEAYPQVQKFVRDLEEKPNLYHELAVYLNHLVDYAIHQSLLLSGEDLKTVFFDLRRNLKAKGRNLALFIEDITAFTGIDAGLVDVLVTQHTGEGNRDFCRVLSVIGITNSYYKDHFPENLKDRIDILLTLNSSEDQNAESALLKGHTVLASMVARYMNAIRASDQQIKEWVGQDAVVDHLPVPCHDCVFQEPCFEAFGAVDIQNAENGKSLTMGLYPFNQQAISNLYDGLSDTVTKTPRALLNSVIAYVLANHGQKIVQNEFPPAASEFGGEFTLPQLIRPEQMPVIERQGGADAPRLLSLVRIWGNRSIDGVEKDGKHWVGGLPESVFQAFGLQFIPGVNRPTGIPAQPNRSQTNVPLVDPTKAAPVVQPISSAPEVQAPRVTNKPEFARFQRDITDWFLGGKLGHYDNYARWVSSFLVNWINWPLYGISEYYAEKKLSAGHIYFEDQIGLSSLSQLRFPRSPEMRDFLISQARVNTLADGVLLGTLEPGVVGSIQGTFSRWLRAWEPVVVKFVQSVKEGLLAEQTIEFLNVQNNVLLNALGGYYDQVSIDDFKIYHNLVKVAKARPDWGNTKEFQNPRHQWAKLRNALDPNTVDRSRLAFLSLFNLPQGRRGSVIFLNAPLVLNHIRTFQWEWKETSRKPIDGIDDPWKSEVQIDAIIRPSFQPALTDLKAILDADFQEVEKLLGGETPQAVLSAFQEVLQNYSRAGKVFHLDVNSNLSGSQLTNLLGTAKVILGEVQTDRLAMLISMNYSVSRLLLTYRTYLQQIYDELVKQEREMDQLLKNAPSRLNQAELNRVKSLYRDMDQELEVLLENFGKGQSK